MIKAIDVIGALIVLSCYAIIIPSIFLSFFAIIPFLFGVGISAQGLASHTSKKSVGVYMGIASGLLLFIFPALGILGIPAALAMVYATPALVASLSLAMAHFANSGRSEMVKREGAPF